MAKKISFIIFVVLFVHQWVFAASLDGNVTTRTLDNGLKIIVKVDSRAPVFISQLWYNAGGSDEPRPITGISHMLEHMMFKGTKAYGAGEFSKIIAKNGGTDNAFTSRDYTAYYQKMHKSKLELAIKLEADRMQNLVLNQAEFEKERQVVIEERRLRIEDNPNAQVYEQLQLISFAKNSVYHAPIIGFQQDIEGYRLQDLQAWYQQYYAPNNAALVVVGDVNPKQVIALATQYFGGYQHNPSIKVLDKTAITRKSNSKILKLKAQLPFYVLSFHVPSLKTASSAKEAYSLEMLSYVLDNSLSKELIRNQQIASSIGLGYRLYDRHGTLLTLSFVPAQGVTNEDVLTAIKKQIAILISQPSLISNALARIKAQLEADFVFQQDQISTQAYYLGMLSTVGLGIDKLSSYVDEVNAINAADVVKVAKAYLNFSDANSVELIPQGIK